MANAINLIDGLDGLACGIVMIAGAAMFLYADRLFKAGLLEGSNMGPLVAAITVGICVGFLPHNFNPARIFMGDAGAMFLGLLLATTTITVGGRTADPFSGQTYFFFAPLVIPLVILGVPIFDTAFSFLRRVWRRQSFAQADHEHLHHRLMRMGHGPRRAVVILWLWTAILSAVVLLPTFTNHGNSLVPLAVIALGLLLYIYFHPGVRSLRAAPVGVDGAREAAADDEAGADVVRARAPAGISRRRLKKSPLARPVRFDDSRGRATSLCLYSQAGVVRNEASTRGRKSPVKTRLRRFARWLFVPKAARSEDKYRGEAFASGLELVVPTVVFTLLGLWADSSVGHRAAVPDHRVRVRRGRHVREPVLQVPRPQRDQRRGQAVGALDVRSSQGGGR